MIKLEALRDLYNPGEYGRVPCGQQFATKPSIAETLIRQGGARRVLYETKIIQPAAPEVTAAHAEPFRLVHLPDPKPAAVAEPGDRVLPGADIPAQRAGDSGQRKRRKRSK